MTSANAKYVVLVQGRGGEVQITRQQVKPDDMETFTDQATDYVNNQPADAWKDAFYMMGEIYDLTSCTCMLPTIVCQAMTKEHHNMTPSRQTRDTMTTFKTKMGQQNYKILNALSHKVENKEKERVAANTQESNAAGPSRAQDGPAGPG